jgi:hypothetical protein
LIGHAQPAAYLIFEKLDALAGNYASHEYATAFGSIYRLGDTFTEVEGAEYNPRKLDRYPLPNVWREFYHKEIHDFPSLLQLLFALSTHWGEGQSYKVYEFMNKEFLPEIKRFYGFDLLGLKKAMSKLPYLNIINAVIPMLGEEYWDDGHARSMAFNILASFFPMLDRGSARKEFIYETYTKKERRTVFLHQHSAIHYWMSDSFGNRHTVADFTDYFRLRYPFYLKSDCLTPQPPAAITKSPLSVFDFGCAHELGLVGEREMMDELLVKANAEESLRLASAFYHGKLKPWQRNRLSAYGATDFALLREMAGKVSAHILDIELKRGEEETEVSRLAMKLERIEGIDVWLDILKALGDEPFVKIDHIYSSGYARKEVLCRLCRICHPSATDTAETMARSAKLAGISPERLMEAALFAPQWLGMVEEATAWKGLQSIACFFHAHVNDQCSDRMKALIAHYTAIDQEDLCAGAFDILWFRQASRETGAKRFGKVFDALRSIISGPEYARISRYIDALNGKTDVLEVRKQVEEKRSRDLLMMYGIMPLGKRPNSDLAERYRYLFRFLDESKAFGSQRHDSEKKAVEIAMANLARNVGYSCITRLAWNMETKMLKTLEPCFSPREISGVKVYMKVDATGNPAIRYFKQGKELANIPGRLRKDPYVIRLRTVSKRLRAVYALSGQMLEQSMEERSYFTISDIETFKKNPFIWPFLEHLVFTDAEATVAGFYTSEGLLDADGNLSPLDGISNLRLAHPVDLHALNLEQAFRTYLRNNDVEQPFEQVFRKRYHATEEETTSTFSLRHSGQQMRPGKTATTLKERGWITVTEEIWQKAYPGSNVVALIETLSHTLGPTDAGLSTMERVSFLQRKTFTPLPAGNIPGHIFSETIRDLESLFA